MYSTCLFCAAKLGANEVVEHFPVGRRLAFDPAKGRLWVVCPRCERWNLTPLEERWEAVEECERLFRSTVVRASTDNIGVAQLREGTRLIRIGKPLRPEFAAWRYGDQFGRRRRRALWIGGAITGTVGAAAAAIVGRGLAGDAAPLLVPALGGLWSAAMVGLIGAGRSFGIATRRMRLHTVEGPVISPQRHLVTNIEMRDDGHGALRVAFDYTERLEEQAVIAHGTVVGDEARQVATRLMPSVNGLGASRAEVRGAVGWLERSGGPEGFIPAMFAETRRLGLAYSPVSDFPAALRLALEMALHEDLERRAIDEELKELEAAWKDAEEIAALADNLFLGRDVNRRFRSLKRGRP